MALVVAIVDDDEAVRTTLASLVSSLGYEARTYRSGTDFLRERRDEDPACMIADIQMPVMAGDELRRVLEAGAHCYLSKPIGGDEIIRCLDEALAGHAPR